MKSTFLKVAVLLFISVQSNLFAQVVLNVEASRSEGVAPLYVFFDATSTVGLQEGNDLINSDFSWNFDVNNNDPDGTWELTKGMVAGHVFEEPGNYEVKCILTAPDATTYSETLIISVSEFQGSTFFVSEDGDDGNEGSEESPWQTAQHAFQHLDGNDQLLFRRGDTFTELTQNLNNLNNGSIIIGAYGPMEMAKPVIMGDDDVVIDIRNSSDIRVMDLHVIPTGAGITEGLTAENSENILALRLEIEQTSVRPFYQDDGSLMGIFDCNLHDFGVQAIFSGSSSRFSVVGNEINNLFGAPAPGHGMRLQGGEKQFVAHNRLTRLDDTKTAITIRGDQQRHVMIYRNHMDRLLGVNPQNAQTVSAISNVVIEGNYIGHNEAYLGNQFEPTINAINIEATQVAVRNNVIDGYRNAIFVGHDYNGVVSGLVDVYHNTIHWRQVTDNSGTSGRIVNVRDVSNVNIQNNLISASDDSNIEVVNQDDGSTNISFANNLVTTDPNYVSMNLPESAAHLNVVSNYQITKESPTIGFGDESVPVFYDLNNHLRTTYDVGAYEYNEIVTVSNRHSKKEVYIFPNPFNNSFSLKNVGEYTNLKIYGSTGSMVFQAPLQTTEFDLSGLSNGIYHIILEGRNLRKHFRVIKN